MGKDDDSSSVGSGKHNRVYCAGINCKPRIRLSSLDCHKKCVACRGFICSFNTPCVECQDWSLGDWDSFKKRTDRNIQKAISKRSKRDGKLKIRKRVIKPHNGRSYSPPPFSPSRSASPVEPVVDPIEDNHSVDEVSPVGSPTHSPRDSQDLANSPGTPNPNSPKGGDSANDGSGLVPPNDPPNDTGLDKFRQEFMSPAFH